MSSADTTMDTEPVVHCRFCKLCKKLKMSPCLASLPSYCQGACLETSRSDSKCELSNLCNDCQEQVDSVNNIGSQSSHLPSQHREAQVARTTCSACQQLNITCTLPYPTSPKCGHCIQTGVSCNSNTTRLTCNYCTRRGIPCSGNEDRCESCTRFGQECTLPAQGGWRESTSRDALLEVKCFWPCRSCRDSGLVCDRFAEGCNHCKAKNRPCEYEGGLGESNGAAPAPVEPCSLCYSRNSRLIEGKCYRCREVDAKTEQKPSCYTCHTMKMECDNAENCSPCQKLGLQCRGPQSQATGGNTSQIAHGAHGTLLGQLLASNGQDPANYAEHDRPTPFGRYLTLRAQTDMVPKMQGSPEGLPAAGDDCEYTTYKKADGTRGSRPISSLTSSSDRTTSMRGRRDPDGESRELPCRRADGSRTRRIMDSRSNPSQWEQIAEECREKTTIDAEEVETPGTLPSSSGIKECNHIRVTSGCPSCHQRFPWVIRLGTQEVPSQNRRRRAVRSAHACQHCRRFKAVCDEAKPSCQKCLQDSQDCVYKTVDELVPSAEPTRVAATQHMIGRLHAQAGSPSIDGKDIDTPYVNEPLRPVLSGGTIADLLALGRPPVEEKALPILLKSDNKDIPTPMSPLEMTTTYNAEVVASAAGNPSSHCERGSPLCNPEARCLGCRIAEVKNKSKHSSSKRPHNTSTSKERDDIHDPSKTRSKQDSRTPSSTRLMATPPRDRHTHTQTGKRPKPETRSTDKQQMLRKRITKLPLRFTDLPTHLRNLQLELDPTPEPYARCDHKTSLQPTCFCTVPTKINRERELTIRWPPPWPAPKVEATRHTVYLACKIRDPKCYIGYPCSACEYVKLEGEGWAVRGMKGASCDVCRFLGEECCDDGRVCSTCKNWGLACVYGDDLVGRGDWVSGLLDLRDMQKKEQDRAKKVGAAMAESAARGSMVHVGGPAMAASSSDGSGAESKMHDIPLASSDSEAEDWCVVDEGDLIGKPESPVKASTSIFKLW